METTRGRIFRAPIPRTQPTEPRGLQSLRGKEASGAHALLRGQTGSNHGRVRKAEASQSSAMKPNSPAIASAGASVSGGRGSAAGGRRPAGIAWAREASCSCFDRKHVILWVTTQTQLLKPKKKKWSRGGA